MKGIPYTLYEAAALDGATSWRRFWNITLPLMTPVILYDLILGVSLGLQIFTQIYIISGTPPGSTANSTLSYVVYIYDHAFTYGNMGYAAAMAWVLFLVTAIFSIVIFASARWWVHYETM